jgi:uncharacterized protein YjbJ (UPF0337 family)
MNQHQVGGRGRQVRGHVKEAIGRATGDRQLEGDGKIDRGIGKVQKKVGDAAAKMRADRTASKTRAPASRAR